MTPEEIFGARILLVDDCEDNLFTISESLRALGYTNVSTVSDPLQVRDLHAANHYDLIVLDMQMPRMNGLEVMQALHEVEKTDYLPVLTVSGESSYKIAALKAGARDFIVKPFDLTELLQRIHNFLEVRLLYTSASEHSRVQEELALHDPLTGLPNRRLLLDRIEKSIQHSARERKLAAVFFLDLDGFKQINDLHGHPFGDLLLKRVSLRLQNITRKHDTVARLGGDEFVMLLSDVCSSTDAVRLATSVLDVLANPHRINGVAVQVNASIGIALYPAHGADAELLIAHADKSLYQAKRAGKNQFHLSAALDKIAL